MTGLTKGNYEQKSKPRSKPKAVPKDKPVSANKNEDKNSFESKVLENLGGSIAFVRPKKGEPLIE